MLIKQQSIQSKKKMTDEEYLLNRKLLKDLNKEKKELKSIL